MTDALNNEIKIGQVYGYSNNTNGTTTIVVGKAVKLTEKGVTLEIISRKRALYEHDPELVVLGTKNSKVNVKGNMIFPVVIEQEIETYRLKTCMGMRAKWSENLSFLTDTEMADMDAIGHTGRTINGENISREAYLNRLGKGTFKVEQTVFDDGSFSEEFLITRVK